MSAAKDFAFPAENDSDKQYNWIQKGLTKRELLAAMCLQGILANPEILRSKPDMDLTGMAVKSADALIAELSKETAS